jgi:hypothetical protein
MITVERKEVSGCRSCFVLLLRDCRGAWLLPFALCTTIARRYCLRAIVCKWAERSSERERNDHNNLKMGVVKRNNMREISVERVPQPSIHAGMELSTQNSSW